MAWGRDSFNNQELVDMVAHHEGWEAAERERFAHLREEINGRPRVDEAFLIIRGGAEPLLDRAVGVASWPWWTTAPLGSSATPIMDALAALARELDRRGLI